MPHGNNDALTFICGQLLADGRIARNHHSGAPASGGLISLSSLQRTILVPLRPIGWRWIGVSPNFVCHSSTLDSSVMRYTCPP